MPVQKSNAEVTRDDLTAYFMTLDPNLSPEAEISIEE